MDKLSQASLAQSKPPDDITREILAEGGLSLPQAARNPRSQLMNSVLLMEKTGE